MPVSGKRFEVCRCLNSASRRRSSASPHMGCRTSTSPSRYAASSSGTHVSTTSAAHSSTSKSGSRRLSSLSARAVSVSDVTVSRADDTDTTMGFWVVSQYSRASSTRSLTRVATAVVAWPISVLESRRPVSIMSCTMGDSRSRAWTLSHGDMPSALCTSDVCCCSPPSACRCLRSSSSFCRCCCSCCSRRACRRCCSGARASRGGSAASTASSPASGRGSSGRHDEGASAAAPGSVPSEMRTARRASCMRNSALDRMCLRLPCTYRRASRNSMPRSMRWPTTMVADRFLPATQCTSTRPPARRSASMKSCSSSRCRPTMS
mmetsp:Transcript_20179/g.68455  ORF Transcript_20179/g.68455 Transcript_20179/m.68455 type:complete len:320 (+) Transcript_20179:311-1270(+)